MTDAVLSDTQRADEARAKLLRDIRELKKAGNKMIDKTETALTKAPVLVGIGALGLALVGIAILAGRRSKPTLPFLIPQRSFLAEASRSAALAALGMVSGRITQRLLTSALETAPRAQ